MAWLIKAQDEPEPVDSPMPVAEDEQLIKEIDDILKDIVGTSFETWSNAISKSETIDAVDTVLKTASASYGVHRDWVIDILDRIVGKKLGILSSEVQAKRRELGGDEGE